MRIKPIFEILKKEIRDIFRDKKTLRMMVLFPLLIFPLFIILFSYVFEVMDNKSIENYNRIGFAFETSEVMDSMMKEMQIDKKTGKEKELEKLLMEGSINTYITKKDNKYMIYYKESDVNSYYGFNLANEFLSSYKTYLQASMLQDLYIDSKLILNVIEMDAVDASGSNAYAAQILNILPMFILMSVTLAAMYPAIDVTAGEKERGTLETLLTFPIKNGELIIGKYLAVTVAAVCSALLSLIATIASFSFVQSTFKIYADSRVTFTLPMISSILIILILYAVFISGLTIAVASFSKSFKEAQNSLTPVSFLAIIPMFVQMMGVNSSYITSLIPYINFSLLINNIISGYVNWGYMLVMALSTIIITSSLIYIIIKLYKSENILFGRD